MNIFFTATSTETLLKKLQTVQTLKGLVNQPEIGYLLNEIINCAQRETAEAGRWREDAKN